MSQPGGMECKTMSHNASQPRASKVARKAPKVAEKASFAAVVAKFEAKARLFHTATICGRQVRFYTSPRWEPDMSWCCLEDMLALAGWGPEQVPDMIRHMHERVSDQVHRMPDGITIIADFAAGGLLAWGIESGLPNGEAMLEAYREAASTVVCARYAYLDLPDFRKVVQMAMFRAVPFVEGEHHVQ